MERTYGLIIRDFDRGESDVILEVFTLKWGRVYLIAKGGRRSKRRFFNKLEPFTYLKILVDGERSGFLRLDQAELVSLFLNLRRDLRRLLCGFYALELLHLMTALWDPHPEVLRVVLKFLAFLDKFIPKEEHLRLLELRMLSELGYRPSFERCVICGRELQEDGEFSLNRGGVVHEGCEKGDFSLSLETIKGVNRILKGGNFPLLSEKFLRECKMVLPAFIERQTSQKIMTLRIMEELEIWNSKS
jgi:DNA repair protein RecO (recombination protein O)